MRRFLHVVVLASLTVVSAFSQTIDELGTWGYAFGTEPESVSGDGSIVVGSASYVSYHHAFRWTLDTGLVDLVPSLGWNWAIARFISRNGTYIVGYTFTPSGNRAAVWTSGGQSLGLPLGNYSHSYAEAVSEDGASIYGTLEQPRQRAAAWINGSLRYPAHLSGMDNSIFSGCSGNGRYAVGRQWESNYSVPGKGFIYDRDTQAVTDVGSLQGGTTILQAMSTNGRFAFGMSSVNGISHGIRWSTKLGLEDLTPFETRFISLSAANKDGTAAVGQAGGTGAIYWSTTTGLISLKELATKRGVPTEEWDFVNALGISDDGLTIVGYGTYSVLGTRGFRLRLPKVRERHVNTGP